MPAMSYITACTRHPVTSCVHVQLQRPGFKILFKSIFKIRSDDVQYMALSGVR